MTGENRPIHTVSTSTVHIRPHHPTSLTFLGSTSRPFEFFITPKKNQPSSSCLLHLLQISNFDLVRYLDLQPSIKSLPEQLPERSTIMAKYMNNHSSNSNQMQRFLDQDSQSTVLATCYSAESSTSEVHGFHYCTTLGAGKYLVTPNRINVARYLIFKFRGTVVSLRSLRGLNRLF